ncbi:MAG TPA: hypothetical protein VMV96_00205 [Acidimicrobiales bacterium]|nr:hypothetical protein [Acidimicrobiales bacterium]
MVPSQAAINAIAEVDSSIPHRPFDDEQAPTRSPAEPTTTNDSTASALRDFHPGWFGAVMGTAIIAIVAIQNPGNVHALATATRTMAQVMTIVTVVLAVGLLVPYLARIVWHHDAALANLRDPAQGGLYGTLPGGILVVAAAASAVGPTWFSPEAVRTIVAVLDWVGVPLAFIVSVAFAHLLFTNARVAPESINGSWFIPPVVNIIVPLVVLPLMPGSSPTTARMVLFMSYAFWGGGFILYLLIRRFRVFSGFGDKGPIHQGGSRWRF